MTQHNRDRRRLLARWLMASSTLLAALAFSNWQPLAEDGIHDPSNPAIAYLQDPLDSLSRFPRDTAGNKVDWIRALNDGYIRPRTTITDVGSVELLDTDILMSRTGSIPQVRFPHKAHTELLACANCHEHPFASRAGATPITMAKILEGEYCGLCHGAVAFPLTECNRCHSVPWD